MDEDLKLRIEVECDRKGISRATLARAVGKSPSGFYNILVRGDMKASLARDIAQYLEIPIELLYVPVSEQEFAEAKKMKLQHRQAKSE